MSAEGEWSYEPRPSERTQEWLNNHRFDKATALGLAMRHAHQVSVNGWTVERVLAAHANGDAVNW